MRADSEAAAIDPAKCPLCGGSNHCARVADPSASECWCGPERFPRGLLARLSERAVRRACICQKCLDRYRAKAGS